MSYVSGGTTVGLGSSAVAGSTPVGGEVSVYRSSDLALLTAPTVALRADATAGQIDAGVHSYIITGNTAAGELYVSKSSAVLTNDGTHTSNTVTVPALTGSITSYSIYRTKAGAALTYPSLWFLVAAAQAPGAYIDIKTDASLTTAPPLQTDDTLKWAIAANETWFFELFVLLQSDSANTDYKLGWSVPAACTMKWAGVNTAVTGGGWTILGAAGAALAVNAATVQISLAGGNAVSGYEFKGSVFNGANAGTVNVMTSMDTAGTGVCTVVAGSYLRARRLA